MSNHSRIGLSWGRASGASSMGSQIPMIPISFWHGFLPRVRALLHDNPTVVGVGFGTRLGARPFDAPVWRIYVSHTPLDEDISLGANLPKTIFGLATQVLCVRFGRATAGAVK